MKKKQLVQLVVNLANKISKQASKIESLEYQGVCQARGHIIRLRKIDVFPNARFRGGYEAAFSCTVCNLCYTRMGDQLTQHELNMVESWSPPVYTTDKRTANSDTPLPDQDAKEKDADET